MGVDGRGIVQGRKQMTLVKKEREKKDKKLRLFPDIHILDRKKEANSSLSSLP